MALEIRIDAGSFTGQKWFALENDDNKKIDPGVKATTPKLLIATADLPPGLKTEPFEPHRIPNPAATVARLEDLEISKNSRSVYGVEVSLTVSGDRYIMIGRTPQRPTETIELGGLGRLNRRLDWELPAWVFDEERRHKCSVIMREIPPPVSSGPSEAVEFVRRFYSYNLDPRPLKP